MEEYDEFGNLIIKEDDENENVSFGDNNFTIVEELSDEVSAPEQLEENASGTGGVPTPKPSESELYNIALESYYNSIYGDNIISDAAQFVVPKVAGFLGSAANIVGSFTEKVPKLAMTAVADMVLDDEEMDEEKERDALKLAIDNMYGSPLFGAAFPGVKALSTVAGGIEDTMEQLQFKNEVGEDFLTMFEDGDYSGAANDLLQNVAEGVPSLLVAMTGPVGIGVLGASAAGEKFEQGYDALEGKQEAVAGSTLWNQYFAAAESGAVESVSAAITGGIGKIAGKAAGAIGMGPTKNLMINTAGKVLAGGGIEFVEEGLADVADRAIDKYQLGDEKAMDGWARGFVKSGIVGAILGGAASGISNPTSKFNELNKNKKNIVANKIQPSSITKQQGDVEKNILKAKLELSSLVNKPELYQAKQEEIAKMEANLNNSRENVNEQIKGLSDTQFKALNDIDNQITQLEQNLDPNFSTELEVETAKNKIQELKDAQTDIFLNPEYSNIKLSEQAQALYDEKGINATSEIIATQEATIRQTAINALNKVPAFKRYEGDVDVLVSELRYGQGGVEALINSYNPETEVPIAAYIAEQLPRRANRSIKQVISQTERTESLEQEASKKTIEDDFDFDVQIGSKVLADQLKLPLNIIESAKLDIPVALENIVKQVTTADSKSDLTIKQRKAIADKALTSIYDSQRNKSLISNIKKEFGKNTKTKQDFTNYLNNNTPVLTKAFVGQKAVEKGSGITKQWAMFPPTKSEFVEYFEGKDVSSNTRSDRKAALAEAVSNQIAFDIQAEYLAANPEIAKTLNERVNEAVSDEKNIIIASAISEKPSTQTQRDIQKDLIANIANAQNPQIKTETLDKKNATQFLNKYIPKDFKKPDFNTEEGRNQIKNALTKAAEEGLLSPNTILGAALGNFGAITKEGDASQILTKNGNYVTKGSPEYTKAFNEGNLIEKFKRGGLYYSTKDPALLNLLQVAQKNYKGKQNNNSVAQVAMKNLLGVRNGGVVNNAKWNEIKNKKNQDVKNNQQIVKDSFLDFHKAINSGANPWEIGRLIIGMYQATRGAIKASYEFKGYQKGNHKEWREEHSPPVNEFAGNLISGLFTLNETDYAKRIEDMYADAGQYLISVDYDNLITNAGFKFRTPIGSVVGNNAGLERIVSSPGINPNEIVLNDGKTIAEKYGAPLDGVQQNPDIVSKQKTVIEENLNPTENIIASAKEKLYKDPANIKLTEEQTVEAFNDILESNWNRDGNKNVSFVTDPSQIEEILLKNNYTKAQAKQAAENNYGFLIGNDIFVNLNAKRGIETAIHETGHLWNGVVFKEAPEVWNGIITKVKESGLFNEYLNKIKDEPAYQEVINSDNSFELENEIFARILEDYGSNKVGKTGSTVQQIKKVIKQYFNELATILGFDPTTKNFGDLNINEMIELAVSEVVTGDPLANFSKLKDSESKTWFRKSKANVDPAFKSSIDPEYQGLKSLQEIYKTNNKDLVDAIKKSYSQVKDIMTFPEWNEFVGKTLQEVQVGKTAAEKALAVAKKNVVQNEAVRLQKIKALKEAGAYTEQDQNLTSQELDTKIKEVEKEAIEKAKVAAEKKGEGLNKNFRKIINTTTGTLGRPSKWFIPPSAEDIKGLLYSFLPGGKLGVEAKKFFNSTILEPYAQGVSAAEAEILARTNQFNEIFTNSEIDINSNVEGTPYTLGDAIKVYNWVKDGIDVDINKQEYINSLVEAVENNSDAKAFAEQVQQNFPIEYKSSWRNDSFNKSIYENINTGTRNKHLATFAENVNNIFDKDNLQEVENLYGKKFRQALENSLNRMKTGRNRVSTDAQSNAFLTWVNRAVATTMFVNTRSAVLQTLSSLNFIGQPNNNIFQATAALFDSNWKKDFNTLWNSDYLKNRRDGAKFDVLADEMAGKGVTGLNKLLKFGFLPTRFADSFAIALGGSAFYRNTVKALVKDGMNESDAKAEAMRRWQRSAEESQQSADPSKISEIQSSNVGKVIYAFANTPFQYARIAKRKLQDVASGRSAAEGGGTKVRQDMQSMLYYTIGQAMLFNGLQTALFAVAFEDDEDEKEKLMDEKTTLAIERTLTSYAKSLGNPGAITAAIYSVIAEAGEQNKKYGKIDNPYKIALEATAISPPLNAKLKDLVAIGNIYKYNEKEIKNDPFKLSPENKALEIVGNAASFGGVPLDRVIRKTQNLAAIANEEADAWQKLFLALGWSKWELGLSDYKKNNTGFNVDFNTDFKVDFNTNFDPINKVSSKDVKIVGKAFKDGTIEVDPNLPPAEKKKVMAHEKKHQQDMKAGVLDYTDSKVTYKGKDYQRLGGQIEHNNKLYMEGHPQLPWEQAANKAERSA